MAPVRWRWRGKGAKMSCTYISRIRLENIRGFRELDLDLRDSDGEPRRRTLIIGQNGTCKTTVLRAIALSFCDLGEANALLVEPIGGFISANSPSGLIHVHLEVDELRLWLERENGKDSVKRQARSRSFPVDSPPLVCGYGAGRYGVGPETGRDYRIVDSVYTLFDYRRTLLDPELTLRRLGDFLGTSRYQAVLSCIKISLGLTSEDEIQLPKGGGVELSGPSIGGRVRLEGW